MKTLFYFSIAILFSPAALSQSKTRIELNPGKAANCYSLNDIAKDSAIIQTYLTGDVGFFIAEVNLPKGQTGFALKDIKLKKLVPFVKKGVNFETVLEDRFAGTDDSVLYFQLSSSDSSVCFSNVLKLSKSNEGPIAEANESAPPLVLTSAIPLPDPCTSCVPQDHLVQFDFKVNNIKTTWNDIHCTDAQTNDLFKRFLRGLPRVAQPFAFQVINVNPFRFDITIADEQVNFNTDSTDLLIAAFTPAPGIHAAAAAENTQSIKEATKLLGAQVNSIIKDLQNAGDCFDPCPYVKDISQQILQYFATNYRYVPPATLEEFLIAKLDLGRTAKDAKDQEEIDEFVAIVKTYSAFRKTGAATVTYLIPQTQNVDQYIFKLNVTPKPGITTGSRVINQDINVNVLGGFKADVSSGLFFTNMVDQKYSLRDSTYATSATGTDSLTFSRNKIVREKGNKTDFGIASFFHFYPRLTTWINPALSVGAGVTLNDKPKLRYLGGLSLLFGRSNRLAFTWGWSMGYVDQLSNKYDDQKDAAGNYYASKKETSVQIQKVFKTNSFFSVTYNIPLTKKRKTVVPGAVADDKKEDTPKDDAKKTDDKTSGKK